MNRIVGILETICRDCVFLCTADIAPAHESTWCKSYNFEREDKVVSDAAHWNVRTVRRSYVDRLKLLFIRLGSFMNVENIKKF